MKILAVLLILFSTPATYAQTKCPGKPANDLDKPHGANEIIYYRSRTVRKIAGRVVAPDESPIKDVVIHVYGCSENNCDQVIKSLPGSRKRLAGLVTDDEGRFCIRDLPSGRYLLVAGTRESKGFQMIYAPILFDNHWWSRWIRSGKQLEITLPLGT